MAGQEILAQLRPAYGLRASPAAMTDIIKGVLDEALAGQLYQVGAVARFRIYGA